MSINIVTGRKGSKIIMRNRHPGKIRDGLWYLGHEETGVYLLEGAVESIVISGGMSYFKPLYIL